MSEFGGAPNFDGSLYYRHSGRFTVSGVILALLLGGLAMAGLAFVYAYVVLYCPFIYVNFIATALYGGAAGAIGTAVLKNRRVRNTSVAATVGLLLGLAAVYMGWVVWMFAFLGRADAERNIVSLATYPALLWAYILRVNEVGAWNLGSVTPTGSALWIVWGAEALLITGVAVLIANFMMKEEPYCEACNNWCTQEPKVAELQSCDLSELKRRLEMKDLGFLRSLGARAADAGNWLRVSLYGCKQCHLTNALTVSTVTVTVDKNNKASSKTARVIENLLITPAECDSIRRIGQEAATLAATRTA